LRISSANRFVDVSAVFMHEHAEANSHKCHGVAILLAGGAAKMKGVEPRFSADLGREELVDRRA
jgi:hypothetical protein